jgi:hypothetical protein
LLKLNAAPGIRLGAIAVENASDISADLDQSLVTAISRFDTLNAEEKNVVMNGHVWKLGLVFQQASNTLPLNTLVDDSVQSDKVVLFGANSTCAFVLKRENSGDEKRISWGNASDFVEHCLSRRGYSVLLTARAWTVVKATLQCLGTPIL